MSKLLRKSEDRRHGHLVECHLGRIGDHSPGEWSRTLESPWWEALKSEHTWAIGNPVHDRRRPGTQNQRLGQMLLPAPWTHTQPPWPDTLYLVKITPNYVRYSSLNTAASSPAKPSRLLWNTVVQSSVLLLCPIRTLVVYFLLYCDY